MDDAGAVVISSWEYCFYQTGVDIRNWVLTSWPYKRQWKRETFHFHHFYLVLLSDSPFFQRGLFLPVPALELDLLVNQSYMTCPLYCHATNSSMCVPHIYMRGGCFFVRACWWNLFFYPGLSRPLKWFMTIGQDSGKKVPQKTLALPEERCWLWVRGTKALILPIATSYPLHNKYFRSWLKPANLKHFIIVALLNCSA